MNTVLWRWVDRPGHESARLLRQDANWLLCGTSVLVQAEQPCRLDYRIVCSPTWETLSARVDGWMGARSVSIAIEVDAQRRWRLNGSEQRAVEGCIDIDLGFSPSTNLLPIRRLQLAVGDRAPVAAAWLSFPGLEFQRLDQMYRRTADRAYEYQSSGGKFVAQLDVDDTGFVIRYGNIWRMEAESGRTGVGDA